MAYAHKRGKNSYEIRVYCGLNSQGKRVYEHMIWKPEQGMSEKQIKAELERQKVLFEDKVRKGEIVNSSITFREFAERWMEDYAKQHHAPKTLQRDREYLNRILPAIGHIKLKDLRPIHLNNLYHQLEEPGVNKKTKRGENGKPLSQRPLAPKTILEHHRMISKILNTAVRWELLDHNVAQRADPPKVPYREERCLNEDELRKMLLLLQNEPMQYQVIITLAVYTGMRRGELCGLEWKDIDFEAKTISIVRTSQYIGARQFITKEPKTHAGTRKLTVGKAIFDMLRRYRAYQNEQRLRAGDQWIDTDRLFTQWNGNPIYPDTITDWFPKFLERSGLPKVKFHSLRHSNATMMIAEGVDIPTVSKRLGHAQISTTLNIYTHALKSRDKDAADKLDEALGF